MPEPSSMTELPVPLPPSWLTYDTLLHSRCGRRFSEHPLAYAPGLDCPFPELPPVSFAETRPAAVKLCPFRDCPWTVTADAPPDVLDETAARHLLAEHEELLVALSRLAEGAELL